MAISATTVREEGKEGKEMDEEGVNEDKGEEGEGEIHTKKWWKGRTNTSLHSNCRSNY